MKINYDKEVDALSVTLRKGTVARTIEISPEIMVDFDSLGNPLYIEILDTSIKVGKKASNEPHQCWRGTGPLCGCSLS